MDNIPNLNERYRRRPPAPRPRPPLPQVTRPRSRRRIALLLLSAAILLILIIGYAMREVWKPLIATLPATQQQSTSYPPVHPTPTPIPEFAIQPYDPQLHTETECVICLIQDWEGPRQPGYYTWHVTFPTNQPALLSMGWCAIDKQTLDANWSQMKYELFVDGYQIDLSQISENEVVDEEGSCRIYSAVLTGWSSTTHSFTWVHHIYKTLSDGWESYEAGEYVMEFIVDVQGQYGLCNGNSIIDKAIVVNTGEKNLNLRQTANGPIIGKIPSGSEIFLLDVQPVEKEGYTWVKICTDDGKIGWVASEFLRISP